MHIGINSNHSLFLFSPSNHFDTSPSARGRHILQKQFLEYFFMCRIAYTCSESVKRTIAVVCCMAVQSTLMLSDNKLFRCHRVYTFYVCMGFHPLPSSGHTRRMQHCTLHIAIHIVLATWSRLILRPRHILTSNITHSRPALMF